MPNSASAKVSAKTYFKNMFTFDLRSGFIAAIVALPLSIGFAVASGVEPAVGIYTAVVAGFLASLFGGSKFSITGPTGSMAIVVLSAVSMYGMEGLFLATVLAGVIQIAMGLLKVGNIIKFMPLPLISGFNTGLGLLIIVRQIPNALGINVSATGTIPAILVDVIENLGSVNFLVIAMTIVTIFIITYLPKLTKGRKYISSIPPTIIALILFMILLFIFQPEIPTIGILSSKLPTFSFFNITFDLFQHVLPFALTLALLGTLESLLCAVVCDGMTATRHDSNRELIGQGIAKIVTPFFGGLPSTAALSRSTVNIREGAKTRVSGMLCSVFLLLILLFFGPLGAYLPNAFIAGTLFCAALPMISVREFKVMMKYDRAEAAIFSITFLLTVFTNMVIAVEVGVLMTLIKFLYDMTVSVQINTEEYDSDIGIRQIQEVSKRFGDKLAIYTINGPFSSAR